MFAIEFRIVEDDKMRSLPLEVFDSEYGDLRGMIQLRFNGNTIGEMAGGIISPEEMEKGVFRSASLFYWFQHLINGLELLQTERHVFLALPEVSDKYLEYLRSEQRLCVSMISLTLKIADESARVAKPLLTTDRLEYRIFKGGHSQGGEAVEPHSYEREWGPVDLSYAEYSELLMSTTRRFIDTIGAEYPNIVKSRYVRDLVASVDRIQASQAG